MGVINVTPDSFSDGGKYFDPDEAFLRAKQCLKYGADVLDIGGQSTRPGADIISPEEELKRITPILKLLRYEFPNALLSVDTYYSKVAERSLELGVDWVNDISGGKIDPRILSVLAETKCPFVITHSRGNSKTMNDLAIYKDVVLEVYNELMNNIENACLAGVSKEQIIIDPGLGFAKNNSQNISLLSHLEYFTQSEFPVLLGPSRKRFIGHILNEPNPNKRIFGTSAVACRCVQAKVNIIRVHDVLEIKQTIEMAKYLWP